MEIRISRKRSPLFWGWVRLNLKVQKKGYLFFSCANDLFSNWPSPKSFAKSLSWVIRETGAIISANWILFGWYSHLSNPSGIFRLMPSYLPSTSENFLEMKWVTFSKSTTWFLKVKIKLKLEKNFFAADGIPSFRLRISTYLLSLPFEGIHHVKNKSLVKRVI